ncbi:hypothetical protein SAMN05661096_00131 [Marivirga sericea]|uniref:TonB protein C-terminal n=1 Tax=Marivirga sericea TaxID=1028 RepID=A0A1X7I239_9BACT|nr:hypothetical protein [Marivirga sericea]SMG08395.1 hypothetical protein SAMN05661096_00131 [Marivirga sericea]
MKRLFLPILILLNLNLLAQIQDIDEPYQKGKVKNGYRVGEWSYYDLNKELALTFDYDSNQLIYLKQDSSSYFIFDEEWQSLQPDRQIRYLGSYVHLYDFLAMNLSRTYSSEASKKNINTVILLELEFDEKGVLVKKNILGKHKEYLEEAILEVTASIPEYWIPAVYQGQTVKSKIAFPLIYTNKTNEKKQPKVADLDYDGKLMKHIKIVGF